MFLPNAPGSEIWMRYMCLRSLSFLRGLSIAPGTGALPILTPPVVESLAAMRIVSSELSLFRRPAAIGDSP
jgi:hypothetical protein